MYVCMHICMYVCVLSQSQRQHDISRRLSLKRLCLCFLLLFFSIPSPPNPPPFSFKIRSHNSKIRDKFESENAGILLPLLIPSFPPHAPPEPPLTTDLACLAASSEAAQKGIWLPVFRPSGRILRRGPYVLAAGRGPIAFGELVMEGR